MAIVPLALILLIMPLNPIFDAVSQPAGAKPLKSILVFSKTGGFRHGSIEQKEHVLPKIASGELRLQAFGVTARRQRR